MFLKQTISLTVLNEIEVLKSHWKLSGKDLKKLNYFKCSNVELVGKIQERYILLHLSVRSPFSNKTQIFSSCIKDDTPLYCLFI